MENKSICMEELQGRISAGENMESVLENFDWREFEKIIAGIFSENGFKVVRNFRFRTKRRYEVDLICSKPGMLALVDCKRWGGGRYKSNGLRRSVRAQKERVKEFKKFLRPNPVAQRKFGFSENSSFQPLVVTLMEEDILESEGCLIVPAWRLNHFLLESGLL